MLNISAAGVAPVCRRQRGTPRPATGRRCEAAIAERRKVEKAEYSRETGALTGVSEVCPNSKRGSRYTSCKCLIYCLAHPWKELKIRRS